MITKKYLLKLSALSTLITLSGFSQASDTYVSGGLGIVGITTPDTFVGDLFDLTSLSKVSTGAAGRVAVGTLWGNTGLKYGVEGAVSYFPHTSATDNYSFDTDGSAGQQGNFNGYALSLLGVLKYQFDSGFLVFAKAGGAYLHEKYSENDTATMSGYTPVTVSYSASGSKVAPEVALGLGYRFNPQFELDLTGDSILANNSSSNAATFDTSNPVGRTNSLMLNLSYHFA